MQGTRDRREEGIGRERRAWARPRGLEAVGGNLDFTLRALGATTGLFSRVAQDWVPAREDHLDAMEMIKGGRTGLEGWWSVGHCVNNSVARL